ncbi:hypothetical protein AAFC00_002579 [Neodothiora populina]
MGLTCLSEAFKVPQVTFGVGDGKDAKSFILHKILVIENSALFDADFDNSRGRSDQCKDYINIRLERPALFGIYAAWLYQNAVDRTALSHLGKGGQESADQDIGNYHGNLICLYIFAEEYEIPLLSNEVITLLAVSNVEPSVICENYPDMPGALQRLLVDRCATNRHRLKRALDEPSFDPPPFDQPFSQPNRFCMDVLKAILHQEERAKTSEELVTKRPIERICDYHEHGSVLEQETCIERLKLAYPDLKDTPGLSSGSGE